MTESNTQYVSCSNITCLTLMYQYNMPHTNVPM
jgi:hypothetical protein